ncbi:hypothetical protein BCR42DRAFT_431405 [Absidia repens]|uniref:Uncharacterized protein n=1 Tax=Absidia repens TaxID=90262 RepID=A0A1X2J1S7_9FUNG|nr:hypothetical protein BCR42DRAFT_431405 [Absidia repens]
MTTTYTNPRLLPATTTIYYIVVIFDVVIIGLSYISRLFGAFAGIIHATSCRFLGIYEVLLALAERMMLDMEKQTQSINQTILTVLDSGFGDNSIVSQDAKGYSPDKDLDYSFTRMNTRFMNMEQDLNSLLCQWKKNKHVLLNIIDD